VLGADGILLSFCVSLRKAVWQKCGGHAHRFRDEFFVIKRYTNLRLLYYTLPIVQPVATLVTDSLSGSIRCGRWQDAPAICCSRRSRSDASVYSAQQLHSLRIKISINRCDNNSTVMVSGFTIGNQRKNAYGMFVIKLTSSVVQHA